MPRSFDRFPIHQQFLAGRLDFSETNLPDHGSGILPPLEMLASRV